MPTLKLNQIEVSGILTTRSDGCEFLELSPRGTPITRDVLTELVGRIKRLREAVAREMEAGSSVTA